MAVVPFHRLARTARYRWWHPLVELVVAIGAGLVLATVVVAIIVAIAGEHAHGPIAVVQLGSTLAVFLLTALLGARVVGRAPGTVASVTGRLRGGWLARTALIALAIMVLKLVLAGTLATVFAVETGSDEPARWVGWERFLPMLIAVLLVIPLQSAAEEYVFRGLFLQAVGGWIAAPTVAILASGVAFGAVHGLALEGFAAVTALGIGAAWITVRTGGLEAAIALHVVNNLVGFLLVAAFGGGDTERLDTINDQVSWLGAVTSLVTVALYCAIVDVLARRQRIATHGAPRAIDER